MQFFDSSSCATTNCDDDTDKHFKAPYFDAASKRLVKQLSELIKCKFGIEI